MVALFAVITLILIIYMYHQAFYPSLVNNGKVKKSPTVVSLVLMSVILLISVLTYRYADKADDRQPHFTYVINNDSYSIVDINEQKTGEKHKYFEFELGEDKHKFEYNDKYLHGSNIYYCLYHNELE